ncbi:MAG: PAS domain S-box protein, partial [Deltaproteobacteria bacterium]|nr:PAS domain S-box protein [Deltaproteobacteria bacterium]
MFKLLHLDVQPPVYYMGIFGGLAMIAVAYFFLYKLISQRIRTLSKITRDISMGNLDLEIPVQGEDSISWLALNIQTMIQNHKDQIAFSNILKNAIPVPVFFVDRDMTITFMNRTACGTSGYSAEEVEGKMKCWDVFNSNKCQTECYLKNTIKTGKYNLQDYQYIQPKRGQPATINVSTAPLKDSKGNITGGLEIFADYSSQIQMENLLKEAAKKQEDDRKYLEERVEKLSGVLVKASEGNLSIHAPVGGKGDLLDQLSAKTNETFDNMGKLIAQTKGAAL